MPDTEYEIRNAEYGPAGQSRSGGSLQPPDARLTSRASAGWPCFTGQAAERFRWLWKKKHVCLHIVCLVVGDLLAADPRNLAHASGFRLERREAEKPAEDRRKLLCSVWQKREADQAKASVSRCAPLEIRPVQRDEGGLGNRWQ